MKEQTLTEGTYLNSFDSYFFYSITFEFFLNYASDNIALYYCTNIALKNFLPVPGYGLVQILLEII